MSTALHHDVVSPRIEERLRTGELTEAQVDAFREFLERVDRDLLHHRDHHRQRVHPLVPRRAGDGRRARATSSGSSRCSRTSSWSRPCCG